MNKQHNVIRAMSEGAIMIAAGEVLGALKFGHLPNGGSVSLMMLPIIVYALRWGVADGLLAGLVMGVLDFALSGEVVGWQSIFGDYILAITFIGLAGIGHKKGMPGVVIGSIVGCLGRFVCVLVTGATIWGEYMPETFLGLTMTNEWFYSFLYNGITVGVSGILTVIICIALYNLDSTQKYILGEDIA